MQFNSDQYTSSMRQRKDIEMSIALKDDGNAGILSSKDVQV